MPTLFVLMVAVFRDGIEDYMHYKQDLITNSQIVEKVVKENKTDQITAQEIKVGDLIKIVDGQEFPADMILIQSSDNGELALDESAARNLTDQNREYQATCYIQTSSLDGEKALKKRLAPKGIYTHIKLGRNTPYVGGYIMCDTPNSEIYEFRGNLNLTDGTKYTNDVMVLSESQLLLKGSMLKNTDWVIGVVVYTGNDTKLMQNQCESRFKQSRVEKENNMTVVQMLVFLLLSSLVIAGCSLIWEVMNQSDAYYLSQAEKVEKTITEKIIFFI